MSSMVLFFQIHLIPITLFCKAKFIDKKEDKNYIGVRKHKQEVYVCEKHESGSNKIIDPEVKFLELVSPIGDAADEFADCLLTPEEKGLKNKILTEGIGMPISDPEK